MAAAARLPYKSLILPKLEYGSQAYHTSAPSNLLPLNSVHHMCLRVCLGAFRTTQIPSLYAESGILSLEDRRKILSMQYYVRSLKIDENTTSSNIRNTRKDKLFENQKKIKDPFGLKVRKLLTEYEMGLPQILIHSVLPIPPWFIPKRNVCFHVNESSKKLCSTEELRQKFLAHKHDSIMDIYTDGSKTEIGVGAGVVVYSAIHKTFHPWKQKLNKLASIFSAELQAIKLALARIETTKNASCTIYSDSLSVLQALNQYDPKNELLQDVQVLIFKISQNNTRVQFCWIPAHCGIFGNELADKSAKSAANSTRICLRPIIAEDMKPHIKRQVFNKCKENWKDINTNAVRPNHLREVDASFGGKDFSCFEKRLDEIKFTRVRLGHSRFTHKYHFSEETRGNPPYCETCRVLWTIKHAVLSCPRYYRPRFLSFEPGPISWGQLLDRKNHALNKRLVGFLKLSDIFSEI